MMQKMSASSSRSKHAVKPSSPEYARTSTLIISRIVHVRLRAVGSVLQYLADGIQERHNGANT